MARLRPVAERGEPGFVEDVARLTLWRNRARSSFLTEFEATDEGTAAWLEHAVAANPDRHLFVLEDLDGTPIGHLGLYGAELDAVLRGVPGRLPGAMAAAILAVVAWGRETLGLSSVSLRVRSDNEGAIALYKRLGWTETRRVPLVPKQEPGRIVLREDPQCQGPLAVIYMVAPP